MELIHHILPSVHIKEDSGMFRSNPFGMSGTLSAHASTEGKKKVCVMSSSTLLHLKVAVLKATKSHSEIFAVSGCIKKLSQNFENKCKLRLRISKCQLSCCRSESKVIDRVSVKYYSYIKHLIHFVANSEQKKVA